MLYSGTTFTTATKTRLTNHKAEEKQSIPTVFLLKFHCSVLNIFIGSRKKCWNLLFPFCFVIGQLCLAAPVTVVAL